MALIDSGDGASDAARAAADEKPSTASAGLPTTAAVLPGGLLGGDGRPALQVAAPAGVPIAGEAAAPPPLPRAQGAPVPVSAETAEQGMERPPKARAKPRSRVRRGLAIVAIAVAVWLGAHLIASLVFRFADPPMSMLMAVRRAQGAELQHEWVPLDRIANTLKRAVIIAEDGKFCRHYGFDVGEIRAALKTPGGVARGASTITQQVAKNLFLWPGKSYVRKVLEVPLTVVLEAVWPKWRIFEVYLNIAEWGPGVFGAEAAAQYHFDKPAAQLSEREAALLAVTLPNPIKRDAADPEPAVQHRAQRLIARMRTAGSTVCVARRDS